MEIKKYPKGSILFREGDTGRDILLLKKGGVEVMKGGKHIGFIVEEGSFIGEMSYLLDKPRSATCVTISDSEIIFITPKKFETTIKQRPEIAIKLAKTLAERLMITTNDLARITKRLEEKHRAVSIDEFIENLDWDKKADLAKIAAKEYFYSRQGRSFEKSSKTYTRFLEALNNLGKDKDYLKNPIDKMMKGYGAYDIYRHYLEREYKLICF
ncbi:MAG: cyclic nucleotide-binding domain-containing protein [Candidatus Hydrogenedentota bacterium]